MGSSAGIEFKADKGTLQRIRKTVLPKVDYETNQTGYGVACTPKLAGSQVENSEIMAETHWDYTGNNGLVFIRVLLDYFEKYSIQLDEIVHIWVR